MAGAHDVALIHLRKPVPGVTPLGYRRAPLPSTFRGELTFIGYGESDGAKRTGDGLRRHLTIPISQVKAATFKNRTQGSNSCRGDSGGSVLDHRGGKWEIVGVISAGDGLCKSVGSSDRVDVVAPWIDKEIAAHA